MFQNVGIDDCHVQSADRSLSIPFSREDTASAEAPEPPTGKAGDEMAKNPKESAGDSSTPKKATKSKLTQDFRTEKGYAAAAQRGDLVTFDVMLDRG